jgi:hypothetical protein
MNGPGTVVIFIGARQLLIVHLHFPAPSVKLGPLRVDKLVGISMGGSKRRNRLEKPKWPKRMPTI